MTPKMSDYGHREQLRARGCRLDQLSAVSNFFFRVQVHLIIICESVLRIDLPGRPFELKLEICLKPAVSVRQQKRQPALQFAMCRNRLVTQICPGTRFLIH